MASRLILRIQERASRLTASEKKIAQVPDAESGAYRDAHRHGGRRPRRCVEGHDCPFFPQSGIRRFRGGPASGPRGAQPPRALCRPRIELRALHARAHDLRPSRSRVAQHDAHLRGDALGPPARGRGDDDLRAADLVPRVRRRRGGGGGRALGLLAAEARGPPAPRFRPGLGGGTVTDGAARRAGGPQLRAAPEGAAAR
jgi:hypothetical protein